jgi:hypothetical protein
MGNEHRIAHMLEGIYERNTMLNSNLNHKTCHALISCFKHIVTIWPGWAHQKKQVPSRLVRSPSSCTQHTRSPLVFSLVTAAQSKPQAAVLMHETSFVYCSPIEFEWLEFRVY